MRSLVLLAMRNREAIGGPMPETTAAVTARKPLLRALYAFVLRLAATRYALPALAGVAIIEATFPFAPPDVMLGPMVLANRRRAYLYAAVCTLGSVVGGVIGYGIGHFAAPLALRLLALSGHATALSSFHDWFAQWGLAVILVKGLTPIPYMLVTLASGVAHFSFPVFVGASLITRGSRFFLEALLLSHPGAEAFVERNLNVLFVLGLVLVAAVVIGFRLLGG
jgi:membrane protein YqaA with SNARE-associated domain